MTPVTSFDPSAVRFAAGRPRARGRPGRPRRTGSHARVHGPGGGGRRPWRAARSTSIRGRAARCGGRARRAATSSDSIDLAIDCDGDAILVTADPVGPTCHRGTRSCFDDGPSRPTDRPTPRASRGSKRYGPRSNSRAADRPEGSYTTSLLDGGVNAVARKVTEEATEVLLAAKDDAAAEGSMSSRRIPARPRNEARPAIEPRYVPRWPVRRPTCCTTRWFCSPSATCRRPRSSRSCGRVTADAAAAGAVRTARQRRPGARSRGGASRDERRATPRRQAPGRMPDR